MVGVLIFISDYNQYKACCCEAYVKSKSKINIP